MNNVYLVHRNDELNFEIDVFEDFELATLYAAAIDGFVTEEPVLRAADDYVIMQLAGES